MEGWCSNLVKVASLLLLYMCYPCSSVELVSSVEEAGRSKACPGETVVFNCTIQATTLLEWYTEPSEGPPVQFAPQYIHTAQGSEDIGEFHAELTHVEHSSGGKHTMQSTLSVTATDTINGTTVYCTDNLNSVSSHSQLLLQDPPSSLSHVTYQVLRYHRDDVTISVHWEHREGEAVDNFTITATASGDTVSTVHTSPPPANLTLPYNVRYTLSVVASNCAGTATGSAIYEQAGCAEPTAPTGGSVSHFESAVEGSEITYHCPPGYMLSGPSTANCSSNFMWIPNSSEVNCTLLPESANESEETDGMRVAIVIAVVLGVGVLLAVVVVLLTVLCVRHNHRKTYIVEEDDTPEERYMLPEVQMQPLGHVTNGPEQQNTEVENSFNEAPASPCVQSGSSSSPYQQDINYALLGPSIQHAPPPAAMNTLDRVHYSTVDHTQEAPPEPVAEPTSHPLDRDINPELIQRQIVELRPQWRNFGSAAGLPHQFLDEVHSSYTDNKDRLAEVVYEWCGRARKVIWADVAGVCRKTGHCELAEALEKAYDTGVLPFKDSQPLPLTPSSKDLPPPPLPPRGDSDGTPPPELPPPPPPDALDDLPSRPPKPSTRHESPPPPYIPQKTRAPVAPPRPPKSSTKPHLPPRT